MFNDLHSIATPENGHLQKGIWRKGILAAIVASPKELSCSDSYRRPYRVTGIFERVHLTRLDARRRAIERMNAMNGGAGVAAG
jgi:hypothetical protein